MMTRILMPEEWDRLERTELPVLLPYVRPDNIDVVVVEVDGKIVASLAVLQATHFEGLWVDPEYRGNAGIMRALLRQATTLARMRGETWVFGGCADNDMRGFMDRVGGKQVPMELYALWLGEK